MDSFGKFIIRVSPESAQTLLELLPSLDMHNMSVGQVIELNGLTMALEEIASLTKKESL